MKEKVLNRGLCLYRSRTSVINVRNKTMSKSNKEKFIEIWKTLAINIKIFYRKIGVVVFFKNFHLNKIYDKVHRINKLMQQLFLC